MELKGMSTSIVIIVAAVVILVTALIVIGVFTGGLGTFQSFFNPWAQNTGIDALCQSKCQSSCFSTGKPPSDYTVEVNGEKQDCPTPCTCSNCAAKGEACSITRPCCTGTCTNGICP